MPDRANNAARECRGDEAEDHPQAHERERGREAEQNRHHDQPEHQQAKADERQLEEPRPDFKPD